LALFRPTSLSEYGRCKHLKSESSREGKLV